MGCDRIIVYVDKTVVKIVGLTIERVNLAEIEAKLIDVLKRPVRVIGVSGDKLEFDVYGIPPEQLYINENNIIEALANEGIKGAEVAKILQAEKVPEIPYDELVEHTANYRGCPAEKWLKWKVKQAE